MHLYASRVVQWYPGDRGICLFGARVIRANDPRFICRRRIRISYETHLYARENNFTAYPGRAVIAL